MSMDFFRDRRNSKFTMLIFGLIILTFIFWGVYDFSGGGQSSVVLKVNGSNISRSEFNAVFQNQMRRYSQFLGGNINENVEEMIKQQVVRNLVNSHLIAQKAANIGLVVGKEQLLDELEKIEAFQDPSTKRFSPRRYQELLQNTEYRNRRNFEESLVRDLLTQQFQSLFSESVLVSKQEASDRERIESYSYTLRSAMISPNRLMESGEITVSEAEMKNYHEQNPEKYLSDELRSIEVARFNTFDYRNTVEITDDEIKTYHDQNVRDSNDEQWNQRRARALHVLISDPKASGKAKIERIKKSIERDSLALESASETPLVDSFRKTAIAESEDFRSAFNGGDLGYFDEQEMVENFGKTVFNDSNPLNKILGPIKTDFGWHLILVLDRTKESRVLSNRSEEIRYILQNQRLEEKLQIIRDELEAEVVGNGQDFTDFFSGRGFAVFKTELIDRKTPQANIPMVLIQKAFQTADKNWAGPEEFEDNLFVYRVAEIGPPQTQSFEQAKAAIEEELKSQKTEQLVTELAQGLASGERSFSSLKAYKATVQETENYNPYLKKEVPHFGEIESLVRAVQAITETKPISEALRYRGSWVVFEGRDFKLSKTDKEKVDALAQSLESQVQRSLLQEYTDELLDRARIPQEAREDYGLTNDSAKL